MGPPEQEIVTILYSTPQSRQIYPYLCMFFYVPIIPIGARPMATRLFGYSAGKYRYTNAQQQSGD